MRITRWFMVIFCLAAGIIPAFADAPWSGTWDTRWRGGGARLTLEQKGGAIQGAYPLYGGKVEGTADGRTFNGRWIEGARSGGFVFALSSDGRSFMGRYESGEWWTGALVSSATETGFRVDRSSPRDAFRTFVTAGNLARRGRLDELGKALDVLEFAPADAELLLGQKLDRAREVFEAIDETTFRVWSAPEGAGEAAEAQFVLSQSGTDATLPLTFRRDAAGKWRIAVPTAETLAGHRLRLLARHGGKPLPSGDHLKLRNPRASLRTFLDGMGALDEDGRARAASTLDLTNIAEPIRAHEGELASEYLRQILDRVSSPVLQEIPDDQASREPYVLFEHPAGRVVLAPAGEGNAARWLFTPETIKTLRPLFAAVENMPAAPDDLAAKRPEPSSFFILRRWMGAISASLLKPLGPIELWQALGILLLAVAGAAGAWYLAPGALAFIGQRIKREKDSHPSASLDAAAKEAHRWVWPLRLLAVALLWYLGSKVLGLPDTVQQVMHASIALLASFGGIWAGLLFIDAVSDFYHRRAARTFSNFDDMLVSFASGAAKIALVVLGTIYAADALNIPWQGIIAGLGIGGLAVAFASRETLSNVFGAGILLMDRPFKRGDWIGTSDDTQGTVEQVGIRSTRIRTAYDTLVVVPNGKLVDATINNYGARRERLMRCKLAISFDARPEQLETFMEALRDLPRAHATLVPGRVQAGVWQLTESAIEAEFVGYLAAASMPEERAARQAVLLDIIRLGERHGVKFAAKQSAAADFADALIGAQAHGPEERGEPTKERPR